MMIAAEKCSDYLVKCYTAQRDALYRSRLVILISVASLAENNWLEAVSYLGTFGAAIAAFWAVYLNQRAQRRQAEQEAEARKPNLLISVAEFSVRRKPELGGRARFVFTNLSQHPVHIRDIVSVVDGMPEIMSLGLLVPAGESKEHEMTFEVNTSEGGQLRFFYHYAITGPVLHRLVLPFSPSPHGHGTYPHTRVRFLLAEQQATSNVEDETGAVNAYYEQS